jgi:DNA (cytosine-5)-methyltransferase 1
MARIIHEVRPKYVFVENSPMLTSRGLGVVLGDLAQMGFDAKWGVLGAADVGAPHQRDRIWILAYSNSINDALRRDGKDNEEGVARGSSKPTGSVCNSGTGCQEISGQGSEMAYTRREHGESRDSRELGSNQKVRTTSPISNKPSIAGRREKIWETEPGVDRVVNGVADGVDRLKALGNGQVSEVARRAWESLSDL